MGFEVIGLFKRIINVALKGETNESENSLGTHLYSESKVH